MKILIYAFMLVTLLACTTKTSENSTSNSSSNTVEEKQQMPNINEGNWVSLFNGKDLDGWHIYNQEGMHNSWSVEDGAIKFTPPNDEENPGYPLDIVTNDEYKNFILSLEWKVSKAGNSGIFWGVKEMEQYKAPYMTGPEIQVLDNENHPDAKNGTSHQAGALYDLISPPDGASKPFGEWNHCILSINQDSNKATAWLNGVITAEFPLHGEEWDAMIAKSKFTAWEHFGKFREGKISLQDHGDVVWFRNVKLQKL